MKSHSVKSNAKRAARQLCEKFPGIEPIEPVRADDGGWYPAVNVVVSVAPWNMPREVEENAKVFPLGTPVAAKMESLERFEATEHVRIDVMAALSLPPLAPSTREEILARREERRQRHAAKAEAEAVAPKPDKNTLVLDLIRRPEGATTDEITAATNGLKHSVRRFISVANSKHKLGIIGRREGKVSRYRFQA